MRVKLFAVTGIILLSPLYAAFASSFSNLTVFGDSLSDNGNAFLLTGGTEPGPNYGTYKFANGLTAQFLSDGPNTTPVGAGPQGLWVDQLASKLGVSDPLPVAASGTNYAVAAAQTGTANPQDMGNQLAVFSATHPGGASSTALYAFWGGANDIFNGGNPIQAADNIKGYIATLSAEGAKSFVWLNLPLLGDTPDGKVQQSALNAASLAFDTEWAKDLAALEGAGISVDGVNIEGLFTGIISNPGAFGFTNVTDAAQGNTNIATDAGYLFWDGVHPTTAGHALVADAVNSTLATPEPASVSFTIIGMLALAGLGIKRTRRS
jgi:phospholipase/lecithinase/hemolysin